MFVIYMPADEASLPTEDIDFDQSWKSMFVTLRRKRKFCRIESFLAKPVWNKNIFKYKFFRNTRIRTLDLKRARKTLLIMQYSRQLGHHGSVILELFDFLKGTQSVVIK